MSIEIKNIEFSYEERKILKSVSFEAKEGELISVLGPNGAGKSTLFRCMLGILKPEKGQTLIDGTDITELTSPQLARKIAYIPQSHNPVFNYSVRDMVLMGTTAQKGVFSSPGRKQEELVEHALEHLKISHLRNRSYGKISGGERQLVLIARAIAQQAKILIMDEPSSSLDFGNKIRLMQAMKDLTKDGYTVIQSTHDPEQALVYSDKVLALSDGQVFAWGEAKEIINASMISKLYQIEEKNVMELLKC